MIAISIAVRPGDSIEATAHRRLLHEAHIRRLHLVRPLRPTITPATHAVRELAEVMGLDAEDHAYFKVECETEPCST